jgi:hypothetical protein
MCLYEHYCQYSPTSAWWIQTQPALRSPQIDQEAWRLSMREVHVADSVLRLNPRQAPKVDDVVVS